MRAHRNGRKTFYFFVKKVYNGKDKEDLSQTDVFAERKE